MTFFPLCPDESLKIYEYTQPNPNYENFLEIGYAEREVTDRMKEH